ncbi:MAG: histidine--tRNA ligase [Nitrospinae bacterium CG11_big_fil_rev_8_21_14_0_20_45_15]|nr:MAG: histidine--tRNA ligase [Nitrospinae bacterium CG11_big_fil_rev_8_21_14_0_20_45_15]
MKIKSIRGVKDILPDEIDKWQWVEKKAHEIFSLYGFKEIRVPIFESTKLFQRGIGDTSDIVQKEMYTFEDKGGEQITLRPEGTAGVVRSYVEHKLYNPPSLLKVFYIGPMFRYERPQAGRFRQFYQIGVEAMGSSNPSVDAEVMTMLMDFFSNLGLKDLCLEINSLGCPDCRPKHREVLKNAIRDQLDHLCGNCNERYERNPLRVLDCKNETCSSIAKALPKTAEHLCEVCSGNFQQVQKYLTDVSVPWRLNPILVRGLDYYGRTAFEVKSSSLGAQDAICGGGRYDYLVEEFEGPATPCFGFALGLERLISLVPFEQMESIERNPDLYLVCLGEIAQAKGFQLANELRRNGIFVDRDSEGASMKSQMRKADKSKSRFALIIGENEIQSGKFVLKSMADGKQEEIDISKDYIETLRQHLKPQTVSETTHG